MLQWSHVSDVEGERERERERSEKSLLRKEKKKRVLRLLPCPKKSETCAGLVEEDPKLHRTLF